MGYNYTIRIGLSDESQKQVSTSILTEIKKVHKQLKSSKNIDYPINELEWHGPSMSNNTGKYLKKFTQVTCKFPGLVFFLYYFSYDNTCLSIYRFKNNKMEEIDVNVNCNIDVTPNKKTDLPNLSAKGCDCDNIPISNIYIPNEITEQFL